MSEVVREATREDAAVRAKRRPSKFSSVAADWRIRSGSHPAPKVRKESSWNARTALGQYLWHVAKLFEIIDEAADEIHIKEHLHSSPPLHMRRTIDQYYYPTVEDTTHRDQDQVVCRGTRSRNDPDATARVVMVDQLWLWILDDSKN